MGPAELFALPWRAFRTLYVGRTRVQAAKALQHPVATPTTGPSQPAAPAPRRLDGAVAKEFADLIDWS